MLTDRLASRATPNLECHAELQETNKLLHRTFTGNLRTDPQTGRHPE